MAISIIYRGLNKNMNNKIIQLSKMLFYSKLPTKDILFMLGLLSEITETDVLYLIFKEPSDHGQGD